MSSPTVNKPVDLKKKDADIARKLQLYGIFAGFQNGKLPSNDQIDVALNSLLSSKGLSAPPQELSAEGKILVTDVCEVIFQAKELVLSKNSGNLLQDFVWQTRQFDPSSVSTVKSPVDKDRAKRDSNDALEGLRTLGRLIITNGQFRKLLKDSTVLFRDMAGDAATNAANRVRPSEEQLSQIDRPAEDNTWHEAPDLSKSKLKERAGHIYGGNAKKDVQDVASAGTSAAQTGNGNAPNAGGAVDAAQSVAQQKIDENADEDTKEKVRARNEELRRKTREYFQKKMPQERKDQTIWRLKKMILECQQHPDYMRAITTLLDLAEQYGSHGRSIGRDATGTAKGTRSSFSQAENDLKTLIERFANGTSTDDLWASINQIYRDADHDNELKEWFKAMDSYVRRCLLEQGYILDEDSTHEWDQLYSHGRYLLRDKYRQHTDRVLNEVKFLAEQFDQDAQNRSFRASIEKLFSDLGHDQNGKMVFKPHLVKDLSEVILPALLANVSYVPIPRIEYSDPQIDAVVENLVLESDNFMPNVASIYTENFFKWGRKSLGSDSKQTFEFTIKGVQMDMRDVSYYVRKKKGFPSMRDQGLVDIFLPGDGFGFKIRMSTADAKDSQRFFKIEKVDVDLKHLQVKFTKSKHKLLFSLIKPLALRFVRPIVRMVAEKSIKDQANRLDELMWQIKQEADAAAQEVYEDPSQAPGIYQRYMKAARHRMEQGKKKAEDAVADKKLNVAMTTETSIFPDVALPGGISTKATEFRDMAKQGDAWQSPVFSIGNAGKSSNVPATPHIERKPHNAEPAPKKDGLGIAGDGVGNGHVGNGYSNGHTNGHGISGAAPGVAVPGQIGTANPTSLGNTDDQTTL
jgi:hypothetical protein